MRIVPKFLQTRCRVCKRDKARAKQEQIAKAVTCGVECPFHSYITKAIEDAYRVQLLSFDLSSDVVLEGETIALSWNTRNCKSATITNHGAIPISGTVQLTVTRRMRNIEINLVDRFDQVFHHTRRIKVRRRPALKIIYCRKNVLVGERCSIQFEATNAKRVIVEDVTGRMEELPISGFFESEVLSRNATLTFTAIGKYGGEAKQEISVQVHEPPFIRYFNSQCLETIDTLPVDFVFDYGNESKVEIFRDGLLIADVTTKKNFTYLADNKTLSVTSPKFELVVTGQTGARTTAELIPAVTIYPQPSIEEIVFVPDKVILFPEKVKLTAHSRFCEKILLSDGSHDTFIEPNESIILNPSVNSHFVFTPIGIQGFRGQAHSVLVEVLHPVKIQVMSNKRVTMPNIPVTISWRSKHHSQILLEPGMIDVTNSNSYEITLEKKTMVKVWGINRRDRSSSEVFIDVLTYPRFNPSIFGRLPKLDLQIPEIRNQTLHSLSVGCFKEQMGAAFPSGVVSTNSLPRFSARLLAILEIIRPKRQLNLSRSLRGNLLRAFKALTREKWSV